MGGNIFNKNISSEKLSRQIIGALFQWRPKYFLAFILLIAPISIVVSLIISPHNFYHCLYLTGINLALWLTIKVCRNLAEVFNLRKEESRITWCYISILLAIGLWIVCFLLVFNIKDNGRVAAAIGTIGAILSLIFQDKIKGVVAFLHLRMHHLLNIGDWIQVPSMNVDGEVKRVTLTSVTINNWDTTTSTIPISSLHTNHFINLQNMMEGRTHGRRMFKSFILDTGSFHPADEYFKKSLVQKGDVSEFLSEKEIEDGTNNAQMFRLYLFHWLMNHPHISQYPRLIVRWMDQVEGGMPLQVYAFIIDSGLPSFEWQQSLIIEHIIDTLSWFDLRFYQRPSGHDMRNRKGGQQ